MATTALLIASEPPPAVDAFATIRSDVHSVQLLATTSSAVLGTEGVASQPGDGVVAVGPAEETDSVADVVNGLGPVLTDLGRGAATVVGLLIAPVFYLTYPVSFLLAYSLITAVRKPPPCAWGCEAVYLPIVILAAAFPFALPVLLFPTSSPAATVRAGVGLEMTNAVELGSPAEPEPAPNEPPPVSPAAADAVMGASADVRSAVDDRRAARAARRPSRTTTTSAELGGDPATHDDPARISRSGAQSARGGHRPDRTVGEGTSARARR